MTLKEKLMVDGLLKDSIVIIEHLKEEIEQLKNNPKVITKTCVCRLRRSRL